MGQVERILTLYQRLIDGRIIDKSILAMEFGTTERSIERDILAIRLFLSESYSSLDLVYDKRLGGYLMKNLRKTHELGEGECFVLSKMLLDETIIREDEQGELIRIILSQMSGRHKEWIKEVSHQVDARMSNSKGRTHTASLKLIEDLLFSIEKSDQITLHFGNGYVDKLCVPFSLEIFSREIVLIALGLADMKPAIIRLDDILSYTPARKPYLLHQKDEESLRNLAMSVANYHADDYFAFINKEERADK